MTGSVKPNVVAGTVSGIDSITISETATYTNPGGSAGGTWSNSNPAIATVNSAGLVTGVASGKANIIYTVTGCGGPLSAQAKVTVRVADLSATIFVRPSTISGPTAITLAVDVIELNGVTSNGTITVKVSKDNKAAFTFQNTDTIVGGRLVQNNFWTLEAVGDESFYTFTTEQSILAGEKLSFGMSGVFNPGATSGTLVITSTITEGSGGEVRAANNTVADKVDRLFNPAYLRNSY